MKRKALYLGLGLSLFLAACGEEQQPPTVLPTLGPPIIPAPVPIRQSVVSLSPPITTNNPAIINEAGDLEISVTLPAGTSAAQLPRDITVAGATFVQSSASQANTSLSYIALNPLQSFVGPISQISFINVDFAVRVSLRTTSRSQAGANPLPGYQNLLSSVTNLATPVPSLTPTPQPTLPPLPVPTPLPPLPTPTPTPTPAGFLVTVPAALNSTALTLSSVAGLNAGQFVAINNYVGLVTSISGNTINLSPPLPFEVPINTLVTSTATPAGFFVTVAASLGTTELTLFSAAGLEVNQFVAINDYTGLITGINNETISLSPPLPFNVPEGTIVTPTPTPAGFFVTVAASLGTTELTLFSAAGLEVNQFVAINDYTGLITGINGDTISLSPPLDFDVEAGTIVTPTVLPDGFFVTVPAGQGAIELTLFSTVGLNVNQFVSINGILSLITAINGNTISLSPPVTADIPAGTIVTPTATPQGAFVIVPATINATTLAVNATTALSVNQFVTINTYTGVITQIVNNVITLSPPVPFAVPVGTVVSPAATPNDTLATPAASGSTTLTIGNASATGITNRSFVSVGGQTVRVSNVAGNVLTITPALTSSVPVGTRATIAPIPTVNAQANAIASASITLVPASSAAFFLVGDGVEIAGTTPEFGGGPRVVTGVNVATGQLTFGAPTITLPMGGTVKLLP